MSGIRATCWSVTINNPTKSDDECIALARQKSGWKIYGQREMGAAGTEHYQLMVTSPQVRFSAMKKAFPRAHIEIARDRTALTKYVQKEDTKIGELAEDQEMYPSLQKVWDLYANYVEDSPRGRKGMYTEWLPNQLLIEFDNFIREAIEQGYVVETIAVNPQIRSCVKQYGINIINRSLRRQIDRQTTQEIIEPNDITQDGLATDKEEEEGDEESTAEGTQVPAEEGDSESDGSSRMGFPY